MAAENLPLLQVDPALLGGAASKPAVLQPAAASPVVKAAPSAATTGTKAAVPAPTEARSSAQASPVAAPPAARELSSTPVSPPAASQATIAPAIMVAEEKPAPPVSTQTQPPVVAEQPTLPPLYSAHIAAGTFPRPTTTPFAGIDKSASPTHVTARKIDGVNEVEVVAEGDALLERGADSLRADRIVYRQAEDEVEAIGNVRLASPDSAMTGPRLRMRLEESTGEFEAPKFTIRRQPPPVPEPALTMSGLPAVSESGQVLATTGRMIPQPAVTGSGEATKLEFRGEDHYYLENASYSTCAPGKRDWEVTADAFDLDYANDNGKASNAAVTFKGVPILYSPWMSFSLSNQRKSGFLTPTVGSTSKSGLDVSLPWYWNIAPDMDATLTPRVMTRRGTQLNTELRYLGFTHSGQTRIEYLPGDKLAKKDRYGYAVTHSQALGGGFAAALNLNGVSDDDYFSDLSTRLSQVSQGSLLRQGVLSYGGPWYGATVNVQTYQTLQGLTEPYRRMPQITGTANRFDLPLGLAFNLNAEYVDFDHPTNLLAKRTTLYPQLSLPLTTSAFWVTPKVGLHVTKYQLDGQRRPDAAAWTGVPAQQNRSVPIYSLAGGIVLERDSNWFGQSQIQTLEPRAYYLYVPRRDQANIPVFDTGIAGFNYAQMFAENRYAGGDRIGDANQLTLALTSRLLDPTTGEEYLRATLGQLHYFTTQHVTLPGEKARTSRSTDMLAALTGQILPKTYADIAWQYNPRDQQTRLLTLGGRYRPEAGKILNAGYRYSRDLVGQIDVSAQWPLAGGWHGVGRYNYSTKEHRVIETIGGVEYDAGCWAGRFVVQRLATIAGKPTTALFFQLELNGLSRIGSNPMDLLRRNIPGYGVINQPTSDPVFGAN